MENILHKLTYSPRDFQLVKDFIKEHYDKNYSIVLFDVLTATSIIVDNPISEILDDIPTIMELVAMTEHTFAHFIDINTSSESYVVGVDINKGALETNSVYRFDSKTKTMNKSFSI